MRIRNGISIFLIVAILAGQIFAGAVLFAPEKAQAQVGAVALATTVPTSDVPTIIERVLIGVARIIMQRFTERFLSRFTNKLVEKYKIRNYLYYDQVLTNYYLSNFIRDKISDPDLRQLYTLLESAYITGAPTGTTGGPDPKTALIPRIKRAINTYYENHYGISTNTALSPPSNLPTSQYFRSLMSYSLYNPGYVERNLRGQFNEFQASSTTAAQLEVIVGNGLKAGRFIGGTCSVRIDNPTPAACTAAGGTWQASALDQARSFIDNPTAFVSNFLDATIKQHIGNLYNPSTDFWTQVGGIFGSFIWNQLVLDRPGSTLPDDPRGYVPDPYEGYNPGPGTCTPIDLDGDGTPDGCDIDGDGIPDVCSFGGNPPNCVLSGDLTGPPEGPTCEESPNWMACRAADRTDLVERVMNYVVSAGIGDFAADANCAGAEVAMRVAWVLRNESAGVIETFHSSRCSTNGISGDLIGFPDSSVVDIIGSLGEANRPQWGEVPGSPNGFESGVRWVPPTDPGDPPGSY